VLPLYLSTVILSITCSAHLVLASTVAIYPSFFILSKESYCMPYTTALITQNLLVVLLHATLVYALFQDFALSCSILTSLQ
jgi:hypothetical protein